MTLPTKCLHLHVWCNIHVHQHWHKMTASHVYPPQTSPQYPHLSPQAVAMALSLVVHNNRMRFGDMIVWQHKGIMMEMSPTPTIVNLYMLINEKEHIINTSTPPTQLYQFLWCFINDNFGIIWLWHENDTTNECKWSTFQSLISSMGLAWEFSDLSNTVMFMDHTITLSPQGTFSTKIYSQLMVLHLYIPPSSCHSLVAWSLDTSVKCTNH